MVGRDVVFWAIGMTGLVVLAHTDIFDKLAEGESELAEFALLVIFFLVTPLISHVFMRMIWPKDSDNER